MPATAKKLGEGGALIGDGGSRVSKYDLKLIRKAVNGSWPITHEMRKTIIAQLSEIAGKAENDRTRVAANKVLVDADDSNIKRANLLLQLLKFQHEEQTEKSAKSNQTTVNVGVGVGVNLALADSVEQLLHEPDYLRYLESRHVAAETVPAGIGDSGVVRANGEPGEVPDPKPRNGHINGHNGHSNGTNGTHAAH